MCTSQFIYASSTTWICLCICCLYKCEYHIRSFVTVNSWDNSCKWVNSSRPRLSLRDTVCSQHWLDMALFQPKRIGSLLHYLVYRPSILMCLFYVWAQIRSIWIGTSTTFPMSCPRVKQCVCHIDGGPVTLDVFNLCCKVFASPASLNE